MLLRQHLAVFEKGVFAVAAPTNGTHASLTNAIGMPMFTICPFLLSC